MAVDPQLILASTSVYRRELLDRLHLPFKQVAPDFKEQMDPSLSPQEIVEHNTFGKAMSILAHFPGATVIASDQIALFDGRPIGKPGSESEAIAQLSSFRGQAVDFLTGVSLCSASQQEFDIIPTQVYFRDLPDPDIATYVRIEQPLDCAGSFKSEGLGITLFERIETDDPTALIGLPLIRLCEWLNPLKLL